MTETAFRRLATVAALALVLVAGAMLVLREGSSYEVTARFVDAGGLVKGNLVQVGGAKVGEVRDIRLAPNGEAEAVLRIDEGEHRPLRVGTRLAIKTIGQSNVANRYIDVSPGPADAPALDDGALIGRDSTRPIVDLDIVLDSFDPPTRRRLQRILGSGARAFSGRAAGDVNRTLRHLDPAVSQARLLGSELGRDLAADARLIVTGAATASALGSRAADLEEGVANTATTLRSIAGEREAFEDTLARAPALIDRAGTTVSNLRAALRVLRPAAREARPVADPLARVIERFGPAAGRAAPVLSRLRSLLPSIRATSRGLPPLARTAVPALTSTSSAVRRVTPVFAGLRPYAPDLISSQFAGTNGWAAGYDANGHYFRLALSEPTLTGILAPLANLNIAGLLNPRTGLTARCPGGAAEPAPDRSNPWVPDRSLCNPEHDHP